MAETNLILPTDLAPAQTIDFIENFTTGQKKLMEALGVTRRLTLAAGAQIKTYKSTVTLADGTVGPGELIPLSKVERKLARTIDLSIRKHRKAVPIESVQQIGFDMAVADTDNKLRGELQREIRRDLFDSIGNDDAQKVTVKNLQDAFAKALLNIYTVFEDVDQNVTPIIFANPVDVTNYLAEKEITVQTAFGLNYVQNFMGVATLILNTDVPAGHVYTTASSNLVVASAALSGGEIGKAFPLATDATNLIGLAHFNDMTELTTQTVAVSYLTFFAEIADGVLDMTLQPPIA